ncbi:MAG TPA: O-antigen ligase family protein [Pyrinomonadaceae bacterium]|nr:O-antigen ligase family protein [Pyrinomonadaceae bacterium]
MKLLIFIAAALLILADSHYDVINEPLSTGRWLPLFLFVLIGIGGAARQRSHIRNPRLFDVGIIAWLTFAFATASYSVSPFLTLQRTSTLLLMYVAVFWVIWSYAEKRGDQNVVDALLSAGLTFLVASWVLMPIFEGMRQPDGRFRGLMENPNSVGLLTALLLPLALFRSLSRRGLLDHLLLALMLLSLALSGNRSGMIAGFVGAMFVLWRARSRMRWVVGAAIIVIAMSFYTDPFLPESWYDNSYVRPESIATGSGRVEVWPIAMEIVEERPLMGFGFGTEELLLESHGFDASSFLEHRGAYFHNSYLGLVAQTGYIGATAFFLPLFVFGVWQFWKSRQETQLTLTPALQGTLLCGLILCTAESWVYSMGNPFAFPFWVSVMLLMRRPHLERKRLPSRPLGFPSFSLRRPMINVPTSPLRLSRSKDGVQTS